jgi:riboflavin kinase/FMN adenylyltransferase
MRTLTTLDTPDAAIAMAGGAVCCIGTFDGVHLGHQQLIRSAVDDAHRRDLAAVVVTFSPHPKFVFGRAPERYLTLAEDKAALITGLGVDVLAIQAFDQKTIATTADEFVTRLRAALGMRALWLGPDFALGYRRQGTPQYLATLGGAHGFTVHVTAQFARNGSPVSSTRIRDALSRGDIADANACLGRSHRVHGTCTGQGMQMLAKQYAPAAGRYRVRIGSTDYSAMFTADVDAQRVALSPSPAQAPGTPLTLDIESAE